MPTRTSLLLAGAAATRRTALLGALGLGVLGAGGCALDGLRVQVPGSGPDSPSSGEPRTSSAARSGDTEADEDLVARLRAQLTPVLALVDGCRRRHGALRSRLAPLASCLRADVSTLRDAVEEGRRPSASSTPVAVPADRDRALQSVVTAVTRLRAQLRTESLRALSGRFARLIASMAAALSQRLRPLAPVALATTVPALRTATAGRGGQDEALQDALAGEHAAVHVFGVLGAQTSQSAQPTSYDEILAAYTWHRDCRDLLVATLRSRGLDPVAAAPSYALPNAVATAAQVQAAALSTERGVTATYGRLVQETVGDDRSWAVALLEQSAERQLLFGGRPETFPGTAT